MHRTGGLQAPARLMTSGLVHPGYCLPEGQVGIIEFLCTLAVDSLAWFNFLG